jgi:hypothetical protein
MIRKADTSHRACDGPTCQQENNYGEWKRIKIQPFGEGGGGRGRGRETNMTNDESGSITTLITSLL